MAQPAAARPGAEASLELVIRQSLLALTERAAAVKQVLPRAAPAPTVLFDLDSDSLASLPIQRREELVQARRFGAALPFYGTHRAHPA